MDSMFNDSRLRIYIGVRRYFLREYFEGINTGKKADHLWLVYANCRCNVILVSWDGFTKAAAGSRSRYWSSVLAWLCKQVARRECLLMIMTIRTSVQPRAGSLAMILPLSARNARRESSRLMFAWWQQKISRSCLRLWHSGKREREREIERTGEL